MNPYKCMISGLHTRIPITSPDAPLSSLQASFEPMLVANIVVCSLKMDIKQYKLLGHLTEMRALVAYELYPSQTGRRVTTPVFIVDKRLSQALKLRLFKK